jgi:hypothetical protein
VVIVDLRLAVVPAPSPAAGVPILSVPGGQGNAPPPTPSPAVLNRAARRPVFGVWWPDEPGTPPPDFPVQASGTRHHGVSRAGVRTPS